MARRGGRATRDGKHRRSARGSSSPLTCSGFLSKIVLLSKVRLEVPNLPSRKLTPRRPVSEKLTIVTIALPLCTGLTSMALSHNWLSSLISIIHLQQFLLQAIHPGSSPLLQLPHINDEVVKAARAIGVENITQFGKLEAGQVEKLMVGWSEKQKRDVFEVAKNWPVTSVIDAKFKGQLSCCS